MEPAFLLHRQNYSNTSLLIECFTLNYGRFPAIAKGARSSRKAKGSILQPFTPLHIQWSGNGEVKTLIKYEAAGSVSSLTGKALYCGFYLNEILVRLLARNDTHATLFKLYSHVLSNLEEGDNLENHLRYFEIDLLQELGYGLELEHDFINNQAIVADRYYHYEVGQGVSEVNADHPGAIQGDILTTLTHRLTLTADQYSQARKLTRPVLSYYLGSKPLKSRELFLPLMHTMQ